MDMKAKKKNADRINTPVSSDLKKRFHIACIRADRSMASVLEDLMSAFVEQEEKAGA